MKVSRMVVFVLLFLIGCASTESQRQKTSVNATKFKMSDVAHFNQEIDLKIGWYPYSAAVASEATTDEWVVEFDDSSGFTGKVPVIIATFPEGQDTLTLGMGIDNALLGKLIKHSLMSQMSIERPFTTFFERAACANCHPPAIEIKN